MALVKYNNNSLSAVTSTAGMASGALTLIKTLTASSSATLSFVHGSSDVVLDSTYPVYLFKFINIHPATDNTQFSFNLTTDGTNFNVTKTTTHFSSYHDEGDSSAAIGYDVGQDLAQGTGEAILYGSASSDNDHGGSGEIYLFNPSSTTFIKNFITRNCRVHKENYVGDNYIAGYGNTASAITGCRFKMSSGNIDSGTIKLYGIKDS
jgi:hypothetical protein